MTEQEAIEQVAATEKLLVEAQKKLTKLRKELNDAESLVIETKLNRDRAKDALRAIKIRQVIPGVDYDLFDEGS